MRRLLHLVRTLLLLTGLLLVVVSATPLDQLWTSWLAGDWRDPRGRTLIVLAGSMMPDGILGESSYWRAVYAVRVYRRGGVSNIFLSGGDGAALAMRDFLIGSGVPAQLIEVETESHSTLENARLSAPRLAALPGPQVLLTSDYHMHRALGVFRKAGLAVEPHPFPDAGKRAARWPGRWRVFLELSEETAKLLYYRWQGWL